MPLLQNVTRENVYRISCGELSGTTTRKFSNNELSLVSNEIEDKSSPSWENGLRFLIVDDTKTNRKMTRKLLSSLGHTVDEAIDGLDFLSKLNINHVGAPIDNYSFNADCYDVVLMDDNMPNMTGPIATKIAREKGYKGIIFGVTGNAHGDQMENFLQSGANKIFEKPLDLGKLKASIDRLCNEV
jgi:CheY-like chemotaxis protein